MRYGQTATFTKSGWDPAETNPKRAASNGVEVPLSGHLEHYLAIGEAGEDTSSNPNHVGLLQLLFVGSVRLPLSEPQMDVGNGD